ncbi:hypothetical protein STCU_11952 [Strigomonas culicis]|uniref:Secreted protein n=1 Tax=Strigomonas culicis TaxID=28005 RepID=S9TF21_9TRYP|nr:hypothetical protein STCU_11952 [Strigomonas culicis]|eukprot:EPY15529.1 hypothetical protein STCU_11952 [Strigomonas culicis]
MFALLLISLLLQLLFRFTNNSFYVSLHPSLSLSLSYALNTIHFAKKSHQTYTRLMPFRPSWMQCRVMTAKREKRKKKKKSS